MKSVPFTIFIHGWDWNYVKYLDVRHNDRKIIVNLLSRAVTVYVLCNDFKEKLVSWGISSNRLQLEYTTVANEFIPDFSLIRSFGKGRKILFLARVVREKGIFIALEAFKLHLQTSPDSIFIVAGVGPDLDEAKIHVQENKISNVQFHGYVDGLLKKKLLSEADIFLFPTFYPEGMPICIFEAMAYGQFIVTRPVGGVADYFTSSMGVALESKEPAVFAEVLNSIVSDVDRLTKVAYFNHDFVSKNCRSILITERILSRMEG